LGKKLTAGKKSPLIYKVFLGRGRGEVLEKDKRDRMKEEDKKNHEKRHHIQTRRKLHIGNHSRVGDPRGIRESFQKRHQVSATLYHYIGEKNGT